MARPSPLVIWTAALSLLALAWAGLVALAVWSQLDGAEREALAALLAPRAVFALALLPLLLLAFALVLRRWARLYPRAALRMRDEVRIIGHSHASHRVEPVGAPEMRALGEAVNALAEVHERLGREVEERIAASQARLAQETARLAALMSELTLGVMVCNRDGRILLYNDRASALFGDAIGLNRSIFGVLDRGTIAHALDQLARRIEQRSARPVAHFVTALRDGGAGRLLRAQMVSLRDEPSGGGGGGFVLILDDITRNVESEARRDQLLRTLTEGTRAALASLRAAAETLHGRPEMDAERRGRFVGVVRDEAQRLSRLLDEAFAAGGEAPPGPWPREDISAADLGYALQRSLEAGGALACRLATGSDALWLQVDSHALVQALSHLARRVGASLGIDAVDLAWTSAGRFARLEIAWQGPPLEPETLHGWEGEPCGSTADGEAATLGQALARQGAELWSRTGAAGERQCLCVQLPVTATPSRPPEAEAQSRPVYYDFDLFHQAGQSAALDEVPLAELTYTVFDTETTGLAPAEGDEIISIGAVRIVNSRLLERECFDRLIRPRRAVGEASQAVHGITPQMLADQPPLEQVLPAFARFAEDTVLVAHNAAFDMRFLELARQRCDVAFEQPVLDTLLLSSLLMPGHQGGEHRLEHIAARLGIPVVGRHTALGDAIVTGEVFLKLLPLLAERGIHTLGQAREASQSSVYASLVY